MRFVRSSRVYREEAAGALAELDAMQQRVQALLRRLAELEAENAALRAGREPDVKSGVYEIAAYPVLKKVALGRQ